MNKNKKERNEEGCAKPHVHHIDNQSQPDAEADQALTTTPPTADEVNRRAMAMLGQVLDRLGFDCYEESGQFVSYETVKDDGDPFLCVEATGDGRWIFDPHGDAHPAGESVLTLAMRNWRVDQEAAVTRLDALVDDLERQRAAEFMSADDRYALDLPLAQREACRQAMEHQALVLKFLGLDCTPMGGAFVCESVPVDGVSASLVVDRSGWGRWEFESDGSEAMPSGWTLLDLAAHLWNVTLGSAAGRIECFIQAFKAREGLEAFSEFGLPVVTDGQLLSRVPEDAPALPPTAGVLDASPVDFPLYSREEGLVGYMRQITLVGAPKRTSGFDQRFYLPLTCWRRPDGSIAWRNRVPKGALPMAGLGKLLSQPNIPVVLTDDEASIGRAEGVLEQHGVRAVGVSLMSWPDSLKQTDLRPLAGRLVYVLLRDPGHAAWVCKQLWKISRRTRVSVVTFTVDLDGRDAPPGGLEAFTSGWTLPEYACVCPEQHWKLSFTIPEPERPAGEEISFGDFVVNDNGVHLVVFRDGVPEFKKIASRIDVVAQARSNDSGDWGVVLRLEDPDHVLHRWCVPRSHLGSDSSYCSDLSSMGAYVSPYPADRTAFTKYLLTAPVTQRARAVFKPGWDGDLFIFADGTHAGYSDEMVSLQTTTPDFRTFNRRGSLEDWKAQVARCCEGNTRLALVVATAFAGPVLSLLGEEGGGFHLTGDSSVGKTTALHVAASVWGAPETFVNSWRGTANGMEAKAVRHNHTLYAMDEMNQISPQEAGEIVYMLANGQGKLRAQQDGSMRQAHTWRLMFLSTGEVGLEQHMASVGQRVMAGQQARLIDIVGDAGGGHGLFDRLYGQSHGSELSVELKQRAATCYGTAGRAWVEVLASPEIREDLLPAIRAAMESFCAETTPGDAHGQVRRVMRRFGLVAAVAEAVAARGILPWPKGEATALIRRCAEQWLQARGGAGNLEANQALTQLRRVLSEFGESGFTELNPSGVETNPNRVTVRRLGFRQVGEDERTDFYILPDTFKDVVCAGMNPRHATEQLKSVGALVLGPDGKAQVVKRLPALGPTRVYHVRSTVLQQGLESVGIDPAS